MENMTLYEVMTIIDDYLNETSTKELENHYRDIGNKDILKQIQSGNNFVLKQDSKKLGAGLAVTGGSAAIIYKLNKDLNKIKDEIQEEENKKTPDKDKLNSLNKKLKSIKSKMAVFGVTGTTGLMYLNSKRNNIKNLPEETRRASALSKVLKESVSSTKLRVYEAYNAGIITESDKISYLNMLEAVSLKVDQYGLIPLPYKIGGVTVALDSFDGKNTPDSVQKNINKYKEAIDFVSKKYNSQIIKVAFTEHLDYAKNAYNNWKDDPKAKTNANTQAYLKEADSVIKSNGKSGLKLFSIRMIDFDSFELNYESPLMTKDGHGMVVEVDVKDGKLITSAYVDG